MKKIAFIILGATILIISLMLFDFHIATKSKVTKGKVTEGSFVRAKVDSVK